MMGSLATHGMSHEVSDLTVRTRRVICVFMSARRLNPVENAEHRLLFLT